MKSQSQQEEPESRVHALVDDRLFQTFWDGVAHFKTKDLVLVFDESETVDPVAIYSRVKIIEDENIPGSLKAKLSKPARDAAVQLSGSDTAFWLIVYFAQGGSACVAINAKPLTPADIRIPKYRH